MHRRDFLRTSVVAVSGAATMGSTFWRAVASHNAPIPGPSPYGELLAPDANGLRLPPDFTSRVVARGGQPVGASSYLWHFFPDGGATFATDDGGWIYVSNSEVGNGGGAGAVRFGSDGEILDAYRILANTSTNCAGGTTPWGTWLSCEEVTHGHVWECDPTGQVRAVPRTALGTFQHEAAVVDPVTGFVYLTEDRSDSRFYRFRPTMFPVPIAPLPNQILASGTLEVARVESGGTVTWLPVPIPNPPGVLVVEPIATRHQVPDSTPFARGEGAWFDAAARTVYFCATTNNQIWAHDVEANTIDLLYEGSSTPNNPLRGADNITVSPGGELLVCEDGGSLQIVMLSPDGVVAPFLQITGAAHNGSEVAGVAFDPSGTRMYLSSQRGYVAGVTYEVSGPFRTVR